MDNKTAEVIDAGQRAASAEAEHQEKLKQLSPRPSKLSDDEAVRLEEEFAALVATHEDQVWNLLRRGGLDSQDVEDLVQEVFLALLHYILERGSPDNVPGMLDSFTKTKRLNHVRGVQRAPFTIGLPSSRSEVPQDGPDIDHILDLQELKRQVFPQLSPEHRAVVEETIMNGLSHRDAAEALGLAEGTVKSRIAAAKREMRARMEVLVPPSQRGAK